MKNYYLSREELEDMIYDMFFETENDDDIIVTINMDDNYGYNISVLKENELN